MEQLEAVPKVLDECLAMIEEYKLLPETANFDAILEEILGHYHLILKAADDHSRHGVCSDLLRIYGYEIKSGSFSKGKYVNISKCLTSSAAAHGKARILLKGAGSSSGHNDWTLEVDFAPYGPPELFSTTRIAEILLVLTVPKYMDRYLMSFCAPGLRSALEDAIRQELSLPPDELERIRQYGLQLVTGR